MNPKTAKHRSILYQAEDEPVNQRETTATVAEVEALQVQLAEVQAQAAEYKDGWQRALADFQNYKRRTDGGKG